MKRTPYDVFVRGLGAVYGWLASAPYCQQCAHYLAKRGHQQRFSADPEQFGMMVHTFFVYITQGRFHTALRYHAMWGEQSAGPDRYLQSIVEQRACHGCGLQWLQFSCRQWHRWHWKAIRALQFSTFYRRDKSVEGPTDTTATPVLPIYSQRVLPPPIACWRCREPIEVTPRTYGKKVRCPACRTKQLILIGCLDYM